ncbi:hypothetical protein KC722_03310 [Candidatus Kaiserbacteria bacterium]|nr:hypothetical protein [Candidatus Kaiserbacteria bacterium]MCB9811462.1 hypothetical protein [Candidatus Nomurabacteria bacterium]
MSKVAIQGVRGSFHDEAAALLVPEAEVLECTSFHDVFTAVETEAEFGVVAIENSLHGSINPIYGLLQQTKLWVAGETTLEIEQYLIGASQRSLDELNTEKTEVRTMFPAFAQCDRWLMEHLPLARRVEMFDTAYSLQTVVDENNPDCIAIAGKHAQEVYGGEILAGPINDDKHNYTRFVLLQKERLDTPDANRTLLILVTGNEEGDLYHALGIFAKAGINLSRLHSHPIPSDTRRYMFYIDIEAGLHEERTEFALKRLQAIGCQAKVLGSYKV